MKCKQYNEITVESGPPLNYIEVKSNQGANHAYHITVCPPVVENLKASLV